MVMMFAVLLVVILILELAAGIAAYALRGDLNELLKNTMLDTMHSYNDSNGKDITTAAWNDLQVNENCCGVTNYTDWWKPGPFEKPLLPSTCCESEQLVNGNCTEMNEFHRNGCFGVLSDSFEKNVGIVGGVGVGIAFVQVIGIVFACCLSRSIRKGYETV
ncbi:unnamed protein product [Darwinula stevensoni]|uniref:Tetraspanin n=1 Tax=Darwinula stevensoni TaxID=69355 RepID=A0A7R9AES9_9CRUS|nr:unnamed protein product [Darwinula stevensoni]CAG0902628.1 unnamed protein product [Darwinula stevensoni]